MRITIRNEISGKTEIIRNPLMPKHIRVGRVFWYRGYTSAHRWDCPGIITRVDRMKKRFWVRSLDDMEDQPYWYNFSNTKNSTDARRMMRLVPPGHVKQFLTRRQKYLMSLIRSARDELVLARLRLAKFKKERRRLKL